MLGEKPKIITRQPAMMDSVPTTCMRRTGRPISTAEHTRFMMNCTEPMQASSVCGAKASA